MDALGIFEEKRIRTIDHRIRTANTYQLAEMLTILYRVEYNWSDWRW